MCGIAGIINFNGQPVPEKKIKNMMFAMKHRGPDDKGTFIQDNVGLGFVRLSILDLSSAGHQPMSSIDERYTIVFNGEVYNYLEIKKKLEDKYQFKSETDTEVVLNAFIEWGEKCLDMFNGMFAFAIYDRKNRSIFAARDRFGVKPFYYFKDYKQFIFASDIASLLTISDVFPNPNDSVIFNYLLTNRTNYSEETFISSIKKLGPGQKIDLIDNKISIKKWYDIENHHSQKGFEKSEEFYDSLRDSIKLQLRSDVPIGVCLSGGLDSSAITSIILKESNQRNLHSYSAIYNKGDKGDEQAFIALYENKGIEMHFIKPTFSTLLNEINNYVEALGEPVPGTSEYAEFKVMQLAKEHSTVILNGQGADEVLGGYDYFYAAYLKELLLKFKILKFLKQCLFLKQNNKLALNLKYLIFFHVPTKLQCFLLKKRNNIFNKNNYQRHLPGAKELIKKFYSFKDANTFFKNHIKYKFEHHLLWADKSGMYFSLETRFPFIDHLLIEKTLSTNIDLILKDGWTKNILRDACKGILDDKIRLRKDKIGFETPESKWFKESEFQKFIWDILNSESFNKRPYFNPSKVRKLYEDHLSNKSDNANIIWKTIHLELWLKKFIDPKIDTIPNNAFAIITPVKNEEDFLKHTIESVLKQRTLPNIWIIVDDGSTDNTIEIVKEYCKKHAWMKLVINDSKNEIRAGGSKVVRAFYKGLEHINIDDYGFIIKLDGDLVLPDNYFEKMMNEFEADPKLGICGGLIINKYSENDFRREEVSNFHVRGALKMVRIRCWKDINGFKEVWNWDGLDVMEAQFNDWVTKSVDIPVIHLRPTSSAYDPIEHSFKSGYEAYRMGNDAFLVLLRSMFKMKAIPYFKLGIAYLSGYRSAVKNKEVLIVPITLAKFINRKHYSRFKLLKIFYNDIKRKGL